MEIDFSAAFDRVDYQGILYMLCSVGIGGYVYTDSFCQTDHSTLWWMVVLSKLVDVVSGVPQGSVLGPLLSFCTLQSFFPFWKIS